MKKNIAIVGSGISGLSASWLLNQKHDITLFEKNNYIGGHSNTVDIVYNDKPISVDTGFIVFNHRTYPNLKAFFEYFDVKTEKSNMSFAVKNLDNNLEYSGVNLKGIFAQKRNILNPQFLFMLKDIVKFNKKATQMVEKNDVDSTITLAQFVNNLGLGKYFQKYYLFPMAAAIWSCSEEMMAEYPAKTFLQFFYNHGLLTVTNQPQWYTVSGGSKNYVRKISSSFSDKIKLNCLITKAYQQDNKIILEDDKGNIYQFDHVIFASHGDQTYQMITDKNEQEKAILGSFKYNKNTAILHKDTNLMPKNKSAWASWVYIASNSNYNTSLTYWMNNLQNIDHEYPLFVTLNPKENIEKHNIFAKIEYEHPIFDLGAVEAQKQLSQIQGKRNMWFCGAWSKYGFHEDGLNSALDIIHNFDVQIPWRK